MTAGLIDKCLKSGIRMTNQQQIILDLIDGSEGHSDADQLIKCAVEHDRTVSIATVCRTAKSPRAESLTGICKIPLA